MALRLRQASSTDYSPGRKAMSYTAGMIHLESVLTVASGISSLDALSLQDVPGVIIDGLNINPSIRICFFNSYCIMAEKSFSEISAHVAKS